ncbi:hypothetical protein SPRG_01339 [Saprolegnia parasitica CBS 223.65]|uniref:CS domain-containing protein n=1 Tax=Saprolegnia parasitica (strain CBS 223.65) TaxID=695850 RepID=A0A067CXS7_SAPPC|nr:hypothetical protein SPRG_01339 [Saprolegnia parasitica CBS 223.65]KDO34065.1 hypothetical protein SPRG_01339 [Saprolegnia parasitica CBS 223.65]|eukprot:XP_012194949.1 hypothetical protein SPRG_01339 [Saprolegnia parasitica CBS 223.65]
MQSRYDDALMGIVQKEGSIHGLLHVFFDFLHRNTDFYVVSDNPQRQMGFAPGVAQNLVLQSFQRFPMKPLEHAPPATTVRPPPSKQPDARPMALTDDGKQVPEGNGGRTDKYSWTQSLQELTVTIPVPAGTKSRDLDVRMTSASVHVAIKGHSAPLVHGTFPGKIKVEESLWSLDSSEAVVLSLEKATPKTWWKSVLEGDAEIDTTKVDSTMHISEYDPVTQGAIRKVMYEQRHGGGGASDATIPSMNDGSPRL